MTKLRNKRPTEYRGFTLIEILLVMLIVSILVLGVNAAYRQAHLIWSNAEDRRPAYHTARLITETLRQELSCLYYPPASKDRDSPFELLYVPNEKTELAFYTMMPVWKGSLQSSRMAKVRYCFTQSPDREETLLQRFEQTCAGEKVIGKESSDVIVQGLSDFRVLAMDATRGSYGYPWKESYDSKDTPPRALKVVLKWPRTKDVPEMNFETSILIPCQQCLESAQPGQAAEAAPPSPAF